MHKLFPKETCEHIWVPVTKGIYFGAVPFRCTEYGKVVRYNPNIKQGILRV